jgi:hypothetical protein
VVVGECTQAGEARMPLTVEVDDQQRARSRRQGARRRVEIEQHRFRIDVAQHGLDAGLQERQRRCDERDGGNDDFRLVDVRGCVDQASREIERTGARRCRERPTAAARCEGRFQREAFRPVAEPAAVQRALEPASHRRRHVRAKDGNRRFGR